MKINTSQKEIQVEKCAKDNSLSFLEQRDVEYTNFIPTTLYFKYFYQFLISWIKTSTDPAGQS